MEKDAVLVVASFGSARCRPEQSESFALEQAVAAAFPGHAVERVYTSRFARRALQTKQILVRSTTECLQELSRRQVRRVAMQPAFLLPGKEYDLLRQDASAFLGDFETLRLGRPLVEHPEDLLALVELLSRAYPRREGEALLLMAHGTSHEANALYAAFFQYWQQKGEEDLFLAALEGSSSLDSVLPKLLASGCRVVHVAPLLLTAGKHVLEDLAGERPDSWKSRLTAAGFSVICHLQGIGLLPEVQQAFCARLAQAKPLRREE